MESKRQGQSGRELSGVNSELLISGCTALRITSQVCFPSCVSASRVGLWSSVDLYAPIEACHAE